MDKYYIKGNKIVIECCYVHGSGVGIKVKFYKRDSFYFVKYWKKIESLSCESSFSGYEMNIRHLISEYYGKDFIDLIKLEERKSKIGKILS